MDSITQAVLGAAVGEALLGRKMGNRAIGWGAFFGTLPDLDVLVSPFLSHSWSLWWHRGPSHSLLVMILASWWLARPLSLLWKRDKISVSRAGWFLFAAWSTHVLIDCFTVYGTSVFWPFASSRVAFNQMFIIDPFFTAPMLVALVWLAFLRDRRQLRKRRRLNTWGIALSAAYALLALAAKQRASDGFERDLSRRGVVFERRMDAPTPFNILLWRSVVDCGDEFWIGYRGVLEGAAQPVRWTVVPKHAGDLNGLMDHHEAGRLVWFTDGWWIARSHAEGAWVADLRFGEMRTWGAREGVVDLRLPFAWDIVPGGPGEVLRQKRIERPEVASMLRRMSNRIIGRHRDWDGQPRLEGVTGSLPELLRVVE